MSKTDYWNSPKKREQSFLKHKEYILRTIWLIFFTTSKNANRSNSYKMLRSFRLKKMPSAKSLIKKFNDTNTVCFELCYLAHFPCFEFVLNSFFSRINNSKQYEVYEYEINTYKLISEIIENVIRKLNSRNRFIKHFMFESAKIKKTMNYFFEDISLPKQMKNVSIENFEIKKSVLSLYEILGEYPLKVRKKEVYEKSSGLEVQSEFAVPQKFLKELSLIELYPYTKPFKSLNTKFEYSHFSKSQSNKTVLPSYLYTYFYAFILVLDDIQTFIKDNPSDYDKIYKQFYKPIGLNTLEHERWLKTILLGKLKKIEISQLVSGLTNIGIKHDNKVFSCAKEKKYNITDLLKRYDRSNKQSKKKDPEFVDASDKSRHSSVFLEEFSEVCKLYNEFESRPTLINPFVYDITDDYLMIHKITSASSKINNFFRR